MSHTLPFPFFVAFLSKKVREYSDPRLHKNFVASEQKFTPKSSFKIEIANFTKNAKCVEPDSSTETSNLSLNNKEVCPAHKNGNQSLNDCRKFAKLPHKDKITVLKRIGLCFSCFNRHLQADCTSKVKCKKCIGKHATLLHFDKRISKDDDRADNSKSNDQTSNLCIRIYATASTLLKTVLKRY